MSFDIRNKRLTFDNILIEELVDEDTSDVFKPIQYADKPEVGRVLALGNTVRIPNLAVNDSVLFSKYSSQKFRFDEKDYFIVKEEDIIAY